METALAGFVRALRLSGVDASPAETIDAMRAIGEAGLSDRESMRLALGASLAKSEVEKDVFHSLFERYFARPSAPGALSGDTPDKVADADNADLRRPLDGAPAFAELAGAGPGAEARLTQALEEAAIAARADDIRFRTQIGFYTRRIMEELGVVAFEAELIRRLESKDPQENAEAELMGAQRAEVQARARAVVEQKFDIFGKASSELFLDDVVVNRPIRELSGRDLERMKALVTRMAKRLAVRYSRRKRTRLRGRPDLSKTIRANAAYDGVPLRLVWKRKRKDRPKIVAICDVSGSVSAYVRFLLLLLYALHEGVADLKAYAFSARLEDVGELLRGGDFEAAMRKILRQVGGGSTDYGQALADFHDIAIDRIDRRTTIIVMGDGRSNNTDPRLDLFAEIAERCGRIIWLCPEPPSMWGTGDSRIPDFRPFCASVRHCVTPADIETAVDQALALSV
jgi:hypothetical protein